MLDGRRSRRPAGSARARPTRDLRPRQKLDRMVKLSGRLAAWPSTSPSRPRSTRSGSRSATSSTRSSARSRPRPRRRAGVATTGSRPSSRCERQAHEWGLWLPHMPEEWGGMGLGHVAMASVSAEAGKTRMGPFALNAQAPDEGNMHTLLHWATDQQKQDYLKPLCDGFKLVDGKPRPFRSCFAMTEPEVAGSDPTLIQTRAYQDGDTWVINGHKWFISGARGAQLRHPHRPHRGRPRPAPGGQLRLPRRHPVRGLGGRARRRDAWPAATTTARSASPTWSSATTRCSAAGARATCSARPGSGRPAWPTACAGSARPRSRST